VPADAEHIATWSPAPALAVAAWLEQTAERHGSAAVGYPSTYEVCRLEGDDDYGPKAECNVYPCPDMAAALTVARAITGAAS